MMPLRRFAVLLAGAAVWVAFAAPGALAGDAPEAHLRTNAQNYKDMLLARCLARVYEKDSVAAKDARSTASVYLDWTEFDAENSTEEIPALLDRYVKRDYQNPLVEYKGIQFGLLKCLDMYHGKELDAQVKRFAIRPNHRYKQDGTKR